MGDLKNDAAGDHSYRNDSIDIVFLCNAMIQAFFVIVGHIRQFTSF